LKIDLLNQSTKRSGIRKRGERKEEVGAKDKQGKKG
jgi:hypothetical protein